jgi:hypothetical protein
MSINVANFVRLLVKEISMHVTLRNIELTVPLGVGQGSSPLIKPCRIIRRSCMLVHARNGSRDCRKHRWARTAKPVRVWELCGYLSRRVPWSLRSTIALPMTGISGLGGRR